MRLFKFLPIMVSWLWLSGCATTPMNQAPQNQTQSWDARTNALSQLTTWDMTALVAIQNTSPPNNITANLKWQQNNQNYTIVLFGPLGSGTATLTGGPHHVSLDTSDGKTYQASTPEALITQQTQWQLPVSSLFYWIRGLPAPEFPSEKQFDLYHHLLQLNQQGWVIHYARYTSLNQLDLPSKLTLSNPSLHVKIIIKSWH